MKLKIQNSKADILTLLKSGHFNFALTDLTAITLN